MKERPGIFSRDVKGAILCIILNGQGVKLLRSLREIWHRRREYPMTESKENYLETILVLSDKGKDVASRVYRKRQTLIRLFRECGKVDQRTAEIDACKVEHVISDITYRGIKQFLEKYHKNT